MVKPFARLSGSVHRRSRCAWRLALAPLKTVPPSGWLKLGSSFVAPAAYSRGVNAGRFTSQTGQAAGLASAESRRRKREAIEWRDQLDDFAYAVEVLRPHIGSRDVLAAVELLELEASHRLRPDEERRHRVRARVARILSPPPPRTRPPEPPSPGLPSIDLATPAPSAENHAPADSAADEDDAPCREPLRVPDRAPRLEDIVVYGHSL
jgi:hypothetical protein